MRVQVTVLWCLVSLCATTIASEVGFELRAEWRRTWGSAVLLHCQQAPQLSELQCFELYEATRREVEGMGGGVYYSSLQQHPMNHSFTHSRGTGTGTETDMETEWTNVLNQKIAIIGANGYIGANLHARLLLSHDVTGYDRVDILPHNHSQPVVIKRSEDISREEIQQYDVVIYLGGLTGRRDCLSHSPAEVFRENIWDPFNIAYKMKPSQLFVFASTSAVSEGSGSREHREDSAVNVANLDEYSRSMFEREVIFNQLSASVMISGVQEAPRLVGLRFGSVVGYSKSQRLNLAFMAMLRSAYTSGYIRVVHPQSYRAIVGLNDLVRAVKSIVEGKAQLRRRFDIFNLHSFNCNIEAIAVEISSAVQVPLIFANLTSHSRGFSLDSNKMKNIFGFQFQESANSVVKVLLENFPMSVMTQGVHRSSAPVSNTSSSEGALSAPCQVCGNKHLQQVLDLGHQPLANSFTSSIAKAYAVERYPLKLVTCPFCNHVQLSHIVDRKKLFQNYLYQSNTSSTLLHYFSWLTDKIIKETASGLGGSRTVIEIACNDGSQLDYFRDKGWRTYGVDPARNLIPYARSKGHDVFEGFWGSEAFNMSLLPAPDEVDVIVAQNVLAHVESPVEFLRACARAMSSKTKLYIQTSQCEMIIEGQFDTAYHEHISFFSAHSFFEAAKLAGLHMSNFEETPVHGISCLVTFELPSEVKTVYHPGLTVVKRLKDEVRVGINTEIFYDRFEAKAMQLENWIARHLSMYSSNGHIIGGYGAAAKGIVMLHFIQKSELFSFIVDDAPLKNGLYCPGTKIPIWNTTQLASLRTIDKPLVLVIFAWNFWEEISIRIRRIFDGSGKDIICIIPFPIPTIVKLRSTASVTSLPSDIDSTNVILASLPKSTFSQPSLTVHKPKIILIANFLNAGFLLPYWIRHHAMHFDEAILVDYHSSDESVEIIQRIAPSNWRVVASRNREQDFTNATVVREELAWYAQLHVDAWVINLEISEFLITASLRNALLSRQAQSKHTLLRMSKLYSFIGPSAVTMNKLDYSLPLKHPTVGIALPYDGDDKCVQDIEGSTKMTVPYSLITQYGLVTRIDSSCDMSQAGADNGVASGSSNKADDDLLDDVFIIDYAWQQFENESGRKYCHMASKWGGNDDVCSHFPGFISGPVDLSDIHGKVVTTDDTQDLHNYMNTYHKSVFATHVN